MSIHTEDIKLVPYKEDYKEKIATFTLPSEQVQFTANPSDLLEKAKEDITKHVVVIVDQDVPVGIFALQTGEIVKEYTNNSDAVLLVSFSVDYEKQGKGYAKRGLCLLQEYVTAYFPGTNEVVLAVNERNIPAQKVYLKVGFEDRGQRKMGPIGRQLILYLSIKEQE
ncbi:MULTISPECIES: GNAT family N-acetyltransferase [unclassified Bacillus cereus group]|uniref:GNAT family N-acetyltransferase n=1 Tax=unclassified Bacillus cereus group TaxID=2750818 RepID=UPI001F57CCAD|nr:MULTISPECIES: GNAT family N-acetyltransferase [unclassified Bacillus cereus group]